MTRRRLRSLASAAVTVEHTAVSDDSWIVQRARLVGSGEAVTRRRPRRRSRQAAEVLVAEQRLLSAIGGGPLPTPVAIERDPAGQARALLTVPAVDRSLSEGVAEHGDVRALAGAVADLADGLARLHRHGYVHTGVRASVAAVTDTGRVVLSGFDAVRAWPTIADRVAPTGESGFSPADDVAALGRLGLGLLDAPTASWCSDPDARGGDRRVDADGPAELRALLNRLVDPDPSRRPDAVTAAALLRRSGLAPPMSATGAASRPNPTTTPATRAGVASGLGAAPARHFGRARPPVRHPAENPAGIRDPTDHRPARRARPVEPSDRRGPRPRPRARALVVGCVATVLLCVGLGRLRSTEGTELTTGLTPSPSGPTAPVAPAVPVEPVEPVAPAVPVAPTAPVEPTAPSVVWDSGTARLEVRRPNGVAHYGLGQPGDEVELGDWDCDGVATPLLRRPSTGEAWRYDGWPTADHPVEAIAVDTDLEPPRC